ncbi:MAG TPA: biliverdin-producing heme oxygenase [Vicinamibacterales bacterium]|nr:biliverdin-producing heme oxygenase [Vicinamibacterales bacterium]
MIHPATAGGGALARMRASLRPLHDQIEATLDLMTPQLDRARYQRFLERSFGFISACEARVDSAAAPPSLDLSGRLKSPLLRADLMELGHTDATLRALPSPARLPNVGEWPAALGYFYVIEGSTLGGQIIARHLRATLDLDHAMAFLGDGRADVGPRWKRMRAVLVATMADDQSERDITASAAQTFDLLRQWHAA